MNRRRFLLLAGSIAALGGTSTAASTSTETPDHPTIRDTVLNEYNWSKVNQYARTSDGDGGEDRGWFDPDIGGSDDWYLTEFSADHFGNKVEEETERTIQAPLSYLWTLRVKPSKVTKLGWGISAPFGEIGEAAVGIDSEVLQEFETKASDRFPARKIEFYPAKPVNMRAVRAAGEAIVSKLPGGSFIDEAKTWIKGPCSGLVTASGKGVFFEKFWIRRRITRDEIMECKGIYSDWVHNGEFRAVGGIVPWSRDHVEDTAENIGYELALEDRDNNVEEVLKRLMGNVEFQ